MINDLSLFQIYGAMARHASESQRVSATNIANADRPGYQAVELESFQDYLARVSNGAPGGGLTAPFKLLDSPSAASPNGNTSSLEAQAFRAAEAKGQHELALTVYTKSLDLMRLALGRRS